MMIPPRTSVVSTSTAGSSTSPTSHVPSIVFDDTPLDQSDAFWSMADASEIESFISCTAHQPDLEARPYDLIPHMQDPSEKEVMCVGQVNLFGSFDRGSTENQYEYDFSTPVGMGLQQEAPHSTLYSTEWHSPDRCMNEPLPSPGTSSSRLSFGIRGPLAPTSDQSSYMSHSAKTKEPTPVEARAAPIKDSGLVDVSQPENDNSAAASKSFPSERADLDLTQFSNSTADASRVLLFLGSTLRSKADKFIDASVIVDPRGDSRRPQGKELFFPDRLYQLLELSEVNGWTDIVSFQPHGRSFRVHDKAAFVARLLPICLQGQGSWSSFLRQLRLYGFTRCESGPDYGAYYHELFLRGRPSLTRYMRRAGVSHGGLDRRTFRLQKGEDPDFYHAYAPMPPLHASNESP